MYKDLRIFYTALVTMLVADALQTKHSICMKTPPPEYMEYGNICTNKPCFSMHLFSCYNGRCCSMNIQSEGRRRVPRFGRGINLGLVTDRRINEASGLAVSHVHPGVLYTHNDSEDSNRIFAIDADSGKTLAEFNISMAYNYDWEDMAVGVCPDRDKTCIYIGDVGGNFGNYGSVKIIYVVEEPMLLRDANLPLVSALHYQWNVFDTETLMVDPNGNVILISKVFGGRGQIGRIPAIAFRYISTYWIRRSTILNLPLTTDVDPLGGDISPNGQDVLLRTHNKIYYWSVEDGDYENILSSKAPAVVPSMPEPQGEAVAWDARGEGYYTLSERVNQPLLYFRRLF